MPLRLGYVGVKNRAQEDIINQIPVKDAIAKEEMYFSSHPIYSSMPSNVLGCHVLTQKLTRILFTHIKHNLPTIITEIREKVKEADEDLHDLGPPLPSTNSEKMQMIWGMILEFLKQYEGQIKGKFDPRATSMTKSRGGLGKMDM